MTVPNIFTLPALDSSDELWLALLGLLERTSEWVFDGNPPDRILHQTTGVFVALPEGDIEQLVFGESNQCMGVLLDEKDCHPIDNAFQDICHTLTQPSADFDRLLTKLTLYDGGERPDRAHCTDAGRDALVRRQRDAERSKIKNALRLGTK